MSNFKQLIPRDRIFLSFDSTNRSSGTISTPIYTLTESIQRVGKIIINKVLLLSNFYTFNTGNNSLGTINATAITISAGTYTSATLAAAIRVAIRATGGGFSAATCVYSSTTRKFTITSGSVSTFDIDSTLPLSQILGFSSTSTGVTSAVSDFVVYETRFVVVADNRSIIVTRAATDYTFYITAGNYSGNTLATELQTAISATLADIAVTYLSNSNKFKFTGTSSFTVKSTGTASTLLGFTSNVASSSNIVTASNPANTLGTTSLHIKSYALSNARLTVISNNTLSNDSIYEFPLDNASGELLVDEPNGSAEIFLSSKTGFTLSTIDLRLCDDTGKIIFLENNSKWKIFLTLEIY